MRREGRLTFRNDLRCPSPRCDKAIVESRDTTGRATYLCKRHGDVIPLFKGFVSHHPGHVPLVNDN